MENYFYLGMILGIVLFFLEIFEIASGSVNITAVIVALSYALYVVSDSILPVVFAMGVWTSLVGMVLLMALLSGVLMVVKKIVGLRKS